jgi:hypothetical protein
VDVITHVLHPIDVRGVQGFKELVNCYRKFVQRVNVIAKALDQIDKGGYMHYNGKFQTKVRFPKA